MGLWRLAADGPARVTASRLPTEDELEQLVVDDPSVLGASLLIIGRQVITPYGGRIDLLGLDASGVLHVLELKRDQTPRDVVAQTLDYTSWAASLGHAELTEIYSTFAQRYGRSDGVLEVAFGSAFDLPPPDELNSRHQMTVMAAAPDPATERIVRFLAETYGVAINMVYFRHFEDDGRRYLARTWLLPEAPVAEERRQAGGRAAKQVPWNGVDFAATYGLDDGNRSWEDARRFGFFSAGGAKRLTQPVRSLTVGQRLWVAVPKHGYVAVGTVAGPAVPMSEARLPVDGVPTPVADLPLQAPYSCRHGSGDDTEWLVPMTWLAALPLEEAVWEKAMYLNQNVVSRLRSEFTLGVLTASPLGHVVD